MKNQVIDVETKGNVIRFYLGENGKQWGDDWDDAPYESNAGVVYKEFVERTVDAAMPFDLFVSEPAASTHNSEWTKKDMIDRKVPALLIESAEWGGTTLLTVHFGDDFAEIAEKLREIFKQAVEASKNGEA